MAPAAAAPRRTTRRVRPAAPTARGRPRPLTAASSACGERRCAELYGTLVRPDAAGIYQEGGDGAGVFDPAAEATKVLDDAVAKLRARHPSVEIHTSVTEGYTAQILVEASVGADLLVVGSRGHGEFAGMLLGSVSEHCVTHAHCPVLVFRHLTTRTTSAAPPADC